MNPRVKDMRPKTGYRLEIITFTNGEICTRDWRPLLTFGVFQELQDVVYFRRARGGGQHRRLAP